MIASKVVGCESGLWIEISKATVFRTTLSLDHQDLPAGQSEQQADQVVPHQSARVPINSGLLPRDLQHFHHHGSHFAALDGNTLQHRPPALLETLQQLWLRSQEWTRLPSPAAKLRKHCLPQADPQSQASLQLRRRLQIQRWKDPARPLRNRAANARGCHRSRLPTGALSHALPPASVLHSPALHPQAAAFAV